MQIGLSPPVDVTEAPKNRSVSVHYLPDADIVMSGHRHGAFMREFGCIRLNRYGTTRQDIQTHINTPSYKNEYRDGISGWAAATKGMPPKPLGDGGCGLPGAARNGGWYTRRCERNSRRK